MPDPLDLARCRELASELVADARSGHLGILYSHGEGAIANTATALRAACAEVERLREALAIEQERRVVTASTMAEHIEDVRTAFVEGMQCAGMTEDGALEMWQHSAALGKLRDIGAFE